MLLDSLREYSKNPYKVFGYLGTRGLLNWMDDETYLKLMFRAKMGKKLDLVNPKTYNEKLQWLKLHDRKPEYTIMVDKFCVREFIKSTIGEEYLIPLLGVWDNAEEIDFDSLPNQFVLKCNHDSGSVIICKDKAAFDKKRAKVLLSNHLKQGTFSYGREWPYKNVKPCILAEKYMESEENRGLIDYKIYCFGGKAKLIMIATDRFTGAETHFDYFDRDFHWLDTEWGKPRSKVPPSMPETFEKMISLAEKLSKGIPHVRVDFYTVNKSIYFGEMTFFDGSGFTPIKPLRWDYTFGSWICLSERK